MNWVLVAAIVLFMGISAPAQIEPSRASTDENEFLISLQSAKTVAEVNEVLVAHKSLITSKVWGRVVAEARQSYEKSEYEQSELLMRAAKQIAEQLNDEARVAASIGFLGEVYLFKGEPSKAIEILLESERMLPGLRAQQYSIALFKDLALAYRDKGDFQTALSYAEQTRHLSEEINDIRQIPRGMNHLEAFRRFSRLPLAAGDRGWQGRGRVHRSCDRG